MTSRPTLFRILRLERRPLALLAMVALMLRVTVIMVGLSISPGVAGEGLGILCQPSVEERQPIPGGGIHDPVHCICGPACHHAGAILVWQPEKDDVPPRSASSASVKAARDAQVRPVCLKANGPIRAPPTALT